MCAALLGAIPGAPDEEPWPAGVPAANGVRDLTVPRAPRALARPAGASAARPFENAGRSGVAEDEPPLRLAVDAGIGAVLRGGALRQLEAGVLGFRVRCDLVPDRLAIERVATGQAAAAFTTRRVSAREGDAGLADEVVGTWVPVVVVHPDDPLRGTTLDQLREVLRGGSAGWPKLDGGVEPVRCILPSAGPIADLYARVLVPGDALGVGERIDDPFDRLRKVASRPGAVTLVALPLAQRSRVRILAIDGVSPDLGSVRLGQYPAAVPVCFVYGRSPDPRLAELLAAVRAGRLVELSADVLLPAR
jgi:hypothetical protein